MPVHADRQFIVLVDDERHVTEALAFGLERPGRTIIVCSDLDAAEIAFERYPVTHLVTDVQFSGQFGFEGLHFLTKARRRAPGCRLVLMTGNPTDVLRTTAMALGASAVLGKPFPLERLEEALGIEKGCDPTEAVVIRLPSVDEILNGGLVEVEFQPIVRITADSTSPFGFEALARTHWMGEGPSLLFDYAGRRDRLADLNLATMQQAIRAAARLPEDSLLFLNVDPRTFDDSRLGPMLIASAARSRISLSRVVLEITERSGFSEAVSNGVLFDDLRGLGIRFALDDHGSAYSHLAVINRIRPAFVKVSQGFGTSFEQDETKIRIIRHVLALASDFGCETILEGVETPATASAAREIGIRLAQGFYFGLPRPPAEWSDPPSLSAA